MHHKQSPASLLLTGYGLVGAFAGLTALLILAHAGSLLNYGFPVMATLVAASLFNTRRSIYTAFVWWIWLFTPLVRRLVDFQTGYHNISPVMVAPLLVTGFTLVAILRRPRILYQRSMLPMLVILLVLIYATVVGAIANGLVAASYDFVNWLLPLGLGVYLLMYPNEADETQKSLLFAIISGLAVISLYGIYQYFNLPPWDAYWIQASGFKSLSNGTSDATRIFGPLNSPGPYADMLMASLVFIIVAKGFLRLSAAVFGIPAFGLTLVRSAWGGWLLAVLYIIWRVGGRTRVRIVTFGGAAALLAIPLLSVGPVANSLDQRFSTFSNIQHDSSFQAREDLYESFAVTAFTTPLGIGFGQIGLASKLTTGTTAVFDSGLLQIPYEFGWPAGAAFIWSISTLAFRVLNATRRTNNRISIAGAGLFIAMLTQNIFASTFSGVLGIAMWVGFGLALAPYSAAAKVRVAPLAQPRLVAETSA